MQLKYRYIDTWKLKKKDSTAKESLLEGAQAIQKKKKKRKFDIPKEDLDDYCIVGIDVGERYAAGVTAVRGSGENKEVRTLALKSNAVNESYNGIYGRRDCEYC